MLCENYPVFDGLYYLSSKKIALIIVTNNSKKRVRAVFLICLLIGSNSLAFANVQAILPAPYGTVVFDHKGGQHYYERSMPADVSAYYKPYVSSLVDSLWASGTMVLLYYMAAGMSSWLPAEVISPAMKAVGMTTLALYSSSLASKVIYFSRLDDEDSRYVIQLMATTASGYSPLHIQRVFDTREHRLFYRIAALPEMPDEAEAKAAGLNDAMWELARVLRYHKRYIELNFPRPEGCHMAGFYCGSRWAQKQPKALKVSAYPDSGEAGLPVTVTLTSADDGFWLEDLLIAYEDALVGKRRNGDRRSSDNLSFNSSDSLPDSLSDYAIEADESASGLWTQGFTFDSPLSPGWIQHLKQWFDNDPAWGGASAEQWSEEYTAGPGEFGAAADDACTSEPCPASRGVITPDKNGCLSLDLGGATYFLPGNLIHKSRPASEKSYCHAVLSNTSSIHVNVTHSAANHWQAETLFFNDMLPRMSFVIVAMAIFGSTVRAVAQRMPFTSEAGSQVSVLNQGLISSVDGGSGAGSEWVRASLNSEPPDLPLVKAPQVSAAVQPLSDWHLLNVRVHPAFIPRLQQEGAEKLTTSIELTNRALAKRSKDLREAALNNIPAPPSFPRRRESTTVVDPRLRGDDDGIFLPATSLRPPIQWVIPFSQTAAQEYVEPEQIGSVVAEESTPTVSRGEVYLDASVREVVVPKAIQAEVKTQSISFHPIQEPVLADNRPVVTAELVDSEPTDAEKRLQALRKTRKEKPLPTELMSAIEDIRSGDAMEGGC